jgi:hypothetical protein
MGLEPTTFCMATARVRSLTLLLLASVLIGHNRAGSRTASSN